MLVARLLSAVPEGDIELACAAVCAGVTGADILSCALMLAFYAGDRRRHGSGEGESVRLTARLLETALPLAVSAYARSALSTLEHLLVPRGLKKSGLGADAALAGYGTIHGMAMPAIGFPSCLLAALAENVIPRAHDPSGARRARGDKARGALAPGPLRRLRPGLRRRALRPRPAS